MIQIKRINFRTGAVVHANVCDTIEPSDLNGVSASGCKAAFQNTRILSSQMDSQTTCVDVSLNLKTDTCLPGIKLGLGEQNALGAGTGVHEDSICQSNAYAVPIAHHVLLHD